MEFKAIKVLVKSEIIAKVLILIATYHANVRSLDDRLCVPLTKLPWTDTLKILLIASVDLLQKRQRPAASLRAASESIPLARVRTHEETDRKRS